MAIGYLFLSNCVESFFVQTGILKVEMLSNKMAINHLEQQLQVSKAVPSVEAHHRVTGSNTGRNYGGRLIIKK